MTAWENTEVLHRKDLPEYYWHKGFFHLNFDKEGYYKRDFEELKFRDLAVYALGNIKGKRVLDVGCGDGLYTLTFLKLDAGFVAGQDISEREVNTAIAICQKNGFSNFEIKTGDCQKLLFEDNSFDLVFSGDVFEHITYEKKLQFTKKIYRVLKPGGILTLKTPNKTYLKATNLIKRISAIAHLQNPLKVYIPHTSNNTDNEHQSLTTYGELKKNFTKIFFHIPEIKHQVFDKKIVPGFFKRYLSKLSFLNPQIIISTRKSIFVGTYD